MNEIGYLPELAKKIKAAVIAKYRNETSHVNWDTDALINELNKVLTARYELAVNIQTFHKNIISNKKLARPLLSDASTRGFIALCCYLCDREATGDFNGIGSLIGLIRELEEKDTADAFKADIGAQLAKWKSLAPAFQHFYAFYCSLGGEPAGVGLLKIDEDWQRAVLIFYWKDKSSFSGPVETGNVTQTAFLSLKDDNSGCMFFVTMLKDHKSPPKEVHRFDGYYCSALIGENGLPVAGKMIVIKHPEKVAEKIARDRIVSDEFSAELLNQRLAYGNQSLSAADVSSFAGDYDCYWFKLRSADRHIVKASLVINDNGTVTYKEDGIDDLTGYIHHARNGILRCSLQYLDDHNYRVLMVFDIRDRINKYADGVYSGHRLHENKLMAGKIRLYKAGTDKALGHIPFHEAREKLGETGDELLKYFWGNNRNGENNNIIQPNLATFRKFFGDRELTNANGDETVNFAGDYLMYRMDSQKNRINCYKLNITASGTFTYTLPHSGAISNYSGNILFIDSSCLVLAVNIKDGLPYAASYIFYVAKPNAAISTASGVYATIAYDKAPVCGRVVLTINKDPEVPREPYEINSAAYHGADPAVFRMLTFLSGTENNLIKGSLKKTLIRAINYKEVFFGYACRRETSEKLKFLELALEHGFNDLKKLREELETGGLSDIKKDVKIHELKNDITRIEIETSNPAADYYIKAQQWSEPEAEQ